jgi:peptidoglycan/LPS O-acetylase OafA/YrhL
VLGAAVVFFSHIYTAQFLSSPAENWFQAQFFGQASMSVSLFFLVSGFVLTWTARDTDTPLFFYRRRIVKLFPNHFVTWAIVLAMIVAGGAFATVGLGTVLVNLFMLQAWSSNIQVFFSMNAPSWSLSCEILFYLSFPFILMAIKRIRPSRLWAWAAVPTVLVFVFPLFALAFLHGPELPHFPLPITQMWFLQVFPVTRLAEFVLGMLLARIVREGRWIRAAGLLPSTVLCVVVYLLVPYVPALYGQTAFGVIPMALLVGAMATGDLAGKRTFLHNRVMIYLGNASFAFYILHQIVIDMGQMLVSGAKTMGPPGSIVLHLSLPVAILTIAVLLAVTTGLSIALHKGVEMPAMRRFAVPKRLRKPKLAPVPTPVLAAEPSAD